MNDKIRPGVGLMGTPALKPRTPSSRLAKFIAANRPQQTGNTGIIPPHMRNPRPGMPPRPGQATTQNPGGIIPPHLQQPRPYNTQVAAPQSGVPAAQSGVPAASASTQGMPQRPQGMPAPGSGINPTVPGVTMPDSARAPRMSTAAAPRPIGGLTAPTPYEMS